MLERVRAHADRYNGDAWRAAVADTLRTRARTIPLAHAIEGERLLNRGFLSWFFSDASRVQDAMLHGESSQFARSNRFRFNSYPINRVGSYAENLAAAERSAQTKTASSTLPRWQRKTQSAPTSDTLFDAISGPHTSNFLDYEDQALATSRATLVILALESYRARTGAYPDTLAELGPTNPTLDTIDPFTGNPFGYRLTPGPADGRPYLLWSAGNDGIDNGGIESGGKPAGTNAEPNWAKLNTDVIFNDPPTPATPTPTRPSPAPPGSN